VVVSAKTDSAQHAAWLEADAYLEKPLSLGKLLEIVNRFCGGEKEGREERSPRPQDLPLIG
jgi:DNA-binding NtrC family response regulator